MGCPACGRSLHDECEVGCWACHETDEEQVARVAKTIATGSSEKLGYIKEPEDVKDRFSTGRKRAAALYPIIKTDPCEWQGKKNCGGGRGIVGCIDGLQRHRHHGPVKDTLRNEPGNLHRICTRCHRRWHAVNDPHYNPEEYNKLPHSPVPATNLELIASEAEWTLKK